MRPAGAGPGAAVAAVAAAAGPMPRGAMRSESVWIGARSLSIGSTFTATVASVLPPDSNT